MYDMVRTILIHIKVENILKNSPNIHLGTFHNGAPYVKCVLICLGDS